MKNTRKWFFLVVGIIFLGILAGTVLVLAISPTNGPTFYSQGAPQLGIAVNQNLVVVDVLAGSPAEKAGLKRGDVLKKIGKQELAVSNDVKKIAAQEIQTVLVPGGNSGPETLKVSPLPLIVNRNTEQFTLSLTPASPPFTSAKTSGTPTPAPNDFTYL